jgi:hypothetical protein
MAEIPFQLLLILAAWSLFIFFRDQKERYIWLFNLFITLGMATKPVLFPFTFLIIIFSIYLFLRTKRKTFILAIGIPLIWIIGYSAWNYQRVGSIQYSSIQTANAVNYNLRYFVMSQEGAEAASKEVDRLYDACGSEATYAEKNRCLDQGVKKIIFNSPFKYALFHLKGSIRYFLDPGRFDLVTFFNIEEPDSPGFLTELNQNGLSGAIRLLRKQGWGLVFVLGLIFLFKLLKAAGFLIYIFRPGKDLPFRIFLVVLVGYLALVTGPLGASRFLLPVELLIIGGAAKGWLSLKIKDPV